MTLRTWLENLQFARDLNRLQHRRRRSPRRKSASDFRLRVESLEDRFLLSTFTVTNMSDGGVSSLRDAITQVNADPGTGTDTIDFAIAGSGVHTIAPLSAPLPTITHSVVIDGTSQPGYAVGAPVIELNGSGAGSGTSGLTLSSSNSTIEGLVINRFSGAGIVVSDASDDLIHGNFVGTDAMGTIAEPNAGAGIQFDFGSTNADITIGGSTTAARNVISGNSTAGIDFGNSFSTGTIVQGNFIGTDVTGTKRLGNTGAGIDLDCSASPDVIANNVISANHGDGVFETTLNPNGTLAEDVIEDNFIGTDVTGTQLLGNAKDGVTADLSSASILLTGNVISANGTGGLDLGSSYGFTTLQGNKVGTDLTGTQPLGNSGVGVSVHSPNVSIGGTAAAEGNVIADNAGAGVDVLLYGFGDGILSTSIFGNKGLGIDLGGNGVTLNTSEGTQNYPILATAFDFGSSTVIQGTLNSRPGATFNVQLFSDPTADPSGYGQGQTYLGSTGVTTDAAGNGAFQVILPVGVPAGQVVSATSTDPYNNTSEFSGDIAVLTAKTPVAAVGDAYNTDARTTLTVAAPGVLANDISIDNGVFTAALVHGAAHGTVVLKADGSFTYTPKNGFTGTDTFTYADVEGTTTSYAATVSISVNAKTQVVTNTNDSGPGSLRQALIIAALSNTADPDQITFAIPGTGPFMIQPLTALPAITHPTVIDGYTQDGAHANTLAMGDNAVIMIQLDGTLADQNSPYTAIDGLAISGGVSTVRGLSITNFGTYFYGGDPIDLTGAGNDVIQGNFLGLNPAGLDTFGNETEEIVVSGAGHNLIGGTSSAARNVLDSYHRDTTISGPNNSVQGNYFNSDLSGTQFQFPSGQYYLSGIVLTDATNTMIGGTKAGAGNVILTDIHVSGSSGGLGSTGTVIEGNNIGVDSTGSVGFADTGVFIDDGSNTIIGGTSPGARNLITHIATNNVSGVLIQGNYIGTVASGLKSLGLNGDGIDLVYSTDVTIGGSIKGAGNLISGYSGDGIVDSYYNDSVVTTTGNVIQGNRIGTDATGNVALPNAGSGIDVEGSSGDLIGGMTEHARNVISGNGQWGVILGNGDINTLVQGNFIGTEITGMKRLGNGDGGILVYNYSYRNTIGGTAKGAGNVISGNAQTGVTLGAGANGDLVEGNFIGTDVAGFHSVGNGSDGVQIQGGSNTIGGTATGAGNVIADNGGAGVGVSPASVYNTILSNSIFGNTKLGIDLGEDGVTANTPGGQNYPVLTVAMTHDGLFGIAGTLNGAPGTSYIVQFFANPAADPSGYGQGQNYLGSVTVLTDATGTAAFTVSLKSHPGTILTATATGPNGATSEFSADIVAVDQILLVQNDSYRVDLNTTLTLAAPGVQANDIALSHNPAISSVVVKPSHGKLTLAADGSFTYLPTAGYIGIDTFTYKDTVDGHSASAQVTITVASKTFVVTTTSDSGPGSLRQAIQSADLATSASPDMIQFAIAGTGPFLIQPATPLPAISHATIIDGYSQSGASPNTLAQGDNAIILIQLDGTNAGGVDGIQLTGGGSTVEGLDVTGFFNGIHEVGDSADVIQGNFIGTNNNGSSALGNGNGIELDGSANTVGGTTAEDRNIISGNSDGVLITGVANLVEGNYLGTDVTGANLNNVVGNFYDGIQLYGSANTIGGTAAATRNLISWNGNAGVEDDSTGNNLIDGNFIGTDVTGSVALGNTGGGLWVADTNGGDTIGGTTAGAGNLISGNGSAGVQDFGSGYNLIEGNDIGTDVSGTQPLGNAGPGVQIYIGDDTLGGTTAGAGNLISGNTGVGVDTTYGAYTLIEGNDIGTDVTGSYALANIGGGIISGTLDTIGGTTTGARNLISGNGGDGVVILYGADLVLGNDIGTDVTGTNPLANAGNGMNIQGTSNTIGGATAGAGNTIAFNAGNGVLVDTATGNAIEQNSIFSNGGLGIDLIDGGNVSQAAPVLTSAVSAGGELTIDGTLTSTADTTFTVELFSNPSGSSEGQEFLGWITVTTDSTGLATFTATFAATLAPGEVITATATDPLGDTSEFSSGVIVT